MRSERARAVPVSLVPGTYSAGLYHLRAGFLLKEFVSLV